MTAIRYPDFRDELSPTPYPFSDVASLRNESGQFIAGETFLGAALFPVGGGSRLYLSRVVVDFQTATLWLGDENGDSLASASFDLLDPGTALEFFDPQGRPAGALFSTPERLASFQAWGTGTHTFEIEETEFVAAVCFPTPQVGLRGILLDDGSLHTGNVWIVGDDGVVVRLEEATEPARCGQAAITYPVVRIDVVGDPLFRRRLCEPDDLFATPRFIRQVTFVQGLDSFTVAPNAVSGDIRILVGNNSASDTVLRVRSNEKGIIFEAAGTDVEEAAG